jgi:hypothetical protein
MTPILRLKSDSGKKFKGGLKQTKKEEFSVAIAGFF